MKIFYTADNFPLPPFNIILNYFFKSDRLAYTKKNEKKKRIH